MTRDFELRSRPLRQQRVLSASESSGSTEAGLADRVAYLEQHVQHLDARIMAEDERTSAAEDVLGVED